MLGSSLFHIGSIFLGLEESSQEHAYFTAEAQHNREGKHNCTGIFQAFMYITFTSIPFAKASLHDQANISLGKWYAIFP